MRSIFALTLLLCCLLEPIMASVEPEISECLAEHSVTLHDVEQATLQKNYVASDQLKCAIKCVMEEVGLVNEMGRLETVEIHKFFDDSITGYYLNHVFVSCHDSENGEDKAPCEKAYSAYQCVSSRFKSIFMD